MMMMMVMMSLMIMMVVGADDYCIMMMFGSVPARYDEGREERRSWRPRRAYSSASSEAEAPVAPAASDPRASWSALRPLRSEILRRGRPSSSRALRLGPFPSRAEEEHLRDAG